MPQPVLSLMETAMKQLKEMVNVNTVIGDPIATADGTVIIPVSKVSLGFGSGGSDLPSKSPKDVFGGGTGAGVSIQPLAFLVVSNGDVKLLQMTTSNNTADKVVNMVPDMFDKIKDLFGKDRDEEKSEQN